MKKDLNWHFFKEDKHISNNHIWRQLTIIQLRNTNHRCNDILLHNQPHMDGYNKKAAGHGGV
jgi:hypothetical protein